MNWAHRKLCAGKKWKGFVQTSLVPGTLAGIDLGDDVLELGPGPGLTTDEIRATVPRLTAVEIDQRLARSLEQRLAGTNVEVVNADATAMPFEDSRFSGAVCFTMLHHVPTAALQDALFAETHRVLRPGATFAGSDSSGEGLRFRLLHLHDTMTPVDPATLAGRLEAAGFHDVKVTPGARTRFRAVA
jgi:ubiquinone/menaquinone biosynthesis C-methylase UbiE